jgi:Cu-Zn family superoxide dismutase
MRSFSGLVLAAALSIGVAQAASKDVQIDLVSADGAPQPVGMVKIEETPYGLLFTPQLKSLPAGIHGFHVHQNGSCASAVTDGKTVPAGAAGGHFDPDKTGKHLGPGTATYPVLAPRLKSLAQISGHALMVHAGGDNHADLPAPLGGGGARMACGVIPG